MHRMHGTREYNSWLSMNQRCLNPNATGYVDYGGRGISICERWKSFQNFYADMGNRPPNRSLDRVDNNGGYELKNCRWATPAQQAKNKRTDRRLNKNNKSGLTGVYLKPNGNWGVQINANGKRIYLGTFSNTEDALYARKVAERKYRGVQGAD